MVNWKKWFLEEDEEEIFREEEEKVEKNSKKEKYERRLVPSNSVLVRFQSASWLEGDAFLGERRLS